MLGLPKSGRSGAGGVVAANRLEKLSAGAVYDAQVTEVPFPAGYGGDTFVTGGDEGRALAQSRVQR